MSSIGADNLQFKDIVCLFSFHFEYLLVIVIHLLVGCFEWRAMLKILHKIDVVLLIQKHKS